MTSRMVTYHQRRWCSRVQESWASQGERVRALFASASGDVTIVAPFITHSAMKSLLEVVDHEAHVRCVTRWLPKEIAAGVSDLAVFDLLEARPSSSLMLVDKLHAKIYIRGNTCLAGSANVTTAAMGASDQSNIEVLIESTVDDPGIASALLQIEARERPASRITVETVRALAADYSKDEAERGQSSIWFPKSRRPDDAFRVYEEVPTEYLSSAQASLVSDIAQANLPAGLDLSEFTDEIRARLQLIPLAQALLESDYDVIVSRADAHVQLSALSSNRYSASDLWLAFVRWMCHFFREKVMMQEVSEFALRRAQVL